MTNTADIVQKTAVRFRKIGPALYHSHHDMIRFWERAVRRAGLPMRMTQGFNPRPRMIFPHALGVGIASRHEEIELELCAAMPVEEILSRLQKECGDTLELTGAAALPPVKKGRHLVASSYVLDGWDKAASAALAGAVADLLAKTSVTVERGGPGEARTVDIRPFVKSLVGDGEGRLRLELEHGQAGGARPDEIVKLLAAATGEDPRFVRIEKTAMVLE